MLFYSFKEIDLYLFEYIKKSTVYCTPRSIYLSMFIYICLYILLANIEILYIFCFVYSTWELRVYTRGFQLTLPSVKLCSTFIWDSSMMKYIFLKYTIYAVYHLKRPFSKQFLSFLINLHTKKCKNFKNNLKESFKCYSNNASLQP